MPDWRSVAPVSFASNGPMPARLSAQTADGIATLRERAAADVAAPVDPPPHVARQVHAEHAAGAAAALRERVGERVQRA